MHCNALSVVETILNAPIGKIQYALEESLKCNVRLTVVEQNSSIKQQFVRKISISVMNIPIIRATVTFDGNLLPDYILYDVLMKKLSIGQILEKNGIAGIRWIKSLRLNFEKNRLFREYEIINDKSTWFVICEEIDLDSLQAILEPHLVNV